MHTPENLIASLQILLAHNYALYLKTQNYHWNVTGIHFNSLHAYFEEMYNDLFTSNDTIAERIAMLGAKVHANLGYFHQTSTLPLPKENSSAKEMLEDLLNDQHTMIVLLKEVHIEAQTTNCEVTVDMIIQRLSVHEKNRWVLKRLLER